MHSRTPTEKDVLVVTEGCKDVAASALLEKDPNTTAGNYVNMIRSLLPAVIALYKEELVLVNLSPQQVFWTGDAAKLLLPRFHRIGERMPNIASPFHSMFFPPQVRLWNWTASEYDSVYVRTVFLLSTRRLGRSSTTICTRSATSTRFSARTPLLLMCLLAGGMLAEACTHKESLPPTEDYLSALHSVCVSMHSGCIQYRPSLSATLRLFNSLFVAEEAVPVPSYHSRPLPSTPLSTQPFPFLASQQRSSLDRDDEWELLQVRLEQPFHS